MQKLKSHTLPSPADSHIHRSCYYTALPLNGFSCLSYDQHSSYLPKCEFTTHSKITQHYRRKKNDVDAVTDVTPIDLYGEAVDPLYASPPMPMHPHVVRHAHFHDCDTTNASITLSTVHHPICSSTLPPSLSTVSAHYMSMASSSEYFPSGASQVPLTTTAPAYGFDSPPTVSMQEGVPDPSLSSSSSIFSLLRQPVMLPSPATTLTYPRTATQGEHCPWPLSSPPSPSISRSNHRPLSSHRSVKWPQYIPSSHRSQKGRRGSPYHETLQQTSVSAMEGPPPVASRTRGFLRYGRHSRPSPSSLAPPKPKRQQLTSLYQPSGRSYIPNGRIRGFSPAPLPPSIPLSDPLLPPSLECPESSFSRRRWMAAKVQPSLASHRSPFSTNRIHSPTTHIPLSSRSIRRSSYYFSGNPSLKRPPMYSRQTLRREPFSPPPPYSRSRWRSRWESGSSRRKSSYGTSQKHAYETYPMNDTFQRRHGSSSCEGYAKQGRIPADTRFSRQWWNHSIVSSHHYLPYRSRKRKIWKNNKMFDQSGNDDRERKQKSKKEAKQDEIVHFQWSDGMLLNKRYRVIDLMGEGTFGRVLRCYDTKMRCDVAVKVVRDVTRYTAAAKIEASILEDIRLLDIHQQSRCVLLLDSFMHENRHMCLVFEKLGLSLYDLLSQNDYKGFFMGDIRVFAQQTLQTLAFLNKIKLTHTDLKPENILLECDPSEVDTVPFLRRPRRADVKLIDFGSATFEDEHHSAIINTRQYRAPEVIFGLGWDMSSDVWSLGCILMELYTGCLLFKTHEHLEHLAMIERIVGPFPPRLVKHARKCDGNKYIHPVEERLFWPEGASGNGSIMRVKQCVSLVDLVLPAHRPFAEFVRYLLEIEAMNRPSPHQALQHNFFKIDLSEY
ncbi:putative cell-cycle-associated protein kinase CLK [Cardiosporidium cionae]|uniref:Cell-cycle-associated protein kinase CLK n=1 Tax=Cardiosporidium cionae TaxID=476202 RepID=A0ABQ7J809_9APIC|nr:putative cell-cycle-associated protein kinase CLK [Cardiosporidium cionae]|eukprot:KAF8820123.1 putative cell-cycle-associated protein kinase CLK [Cardiosporidium cionae]